MPSKNLLYASNALASTPFMVYFTLYDRTRLLGTKNDKKPKSNLTSS